MDNLALLLGQLSPMFRLFNYIVDGEGGEPATEPAEPAEPAEPSEPAEPNKPATPEPKKHMFDWKRDLIADYQNSPTVQKFGNDVDGLNSFVKSTLELERLLGHEKVPIPKGPDDVEGWDRFSKAMGIPVKSEDYKLTDPTLPEALQGKVMNKKEFGDLMVANKLTPNQANSLWDIYNKVTVDNYNKAMEEYQTKLNGLRDKLKETWGDAFDSNVDLGKTVIDRFSEDQEMADFITAAMLSDPRGAKFLASMGTKFAENKIDGFAHKKFAKSPSDAQKEIDSILGNPEHPYNNDKAPQEEHDRAVDYVNNLYTIVNKSR